MTQITFKNEIDKKKLEILLNLLKSWDIDVEVKVDLFAETRGIWADYDITDKQLREKAWGTAKRFPK